MAHLEGRVTTQIEYTMQRHRVSLEQIADYDNLLEASWRAAKGKWSRSEVRSFFGRLRFNLRQLRDGILHEDVTVGQHHRFRIYDPKPRTIYAPCFRERVLHHALMRYVGPILERSLIDDTFACLQERGSLAAVNRCQKHVRRYPWYAKMDVRQYFASIDHSILFHQLER